MIRSLLLAAGFLIVTIALLFLQPSSRQGDDGFEAAPVTRADTTPEPVRPIVQPKPKLAEVEPEPELEVQPAERRSLFSRETVAEPEPTVADEKTFADTSGDPVQSQVAMMTQNILQELRSPSTSTRTAAPAPAPSPAAAPAPVAVVAATPVVREEPVVVPVRPRIETDLTQGDLAGLSDFDLEQMLRDAVARGDVEVEPAFLTTAGDVDYKALLAAYVPNRAPPTGGVVSQEFLYRIQPGDSLAGLASMFYGDPNKHTLIRLANATALPGQTYPAPGFLITIPAQ